MGRKKKSPEDGMVEMLIGNIGQLSEDGQRAILGYLREKYPDTLTPPHVLAEERLVQDYLVDYKTVGDFFEMDAGSISSCNDVFRVAGALVDKSRVLFKEGAKLGKEKYLYRSVVIYSLKTFMDLMDLKLNTLLNLILVKEKGQNKFTSYAKEFQYVFNVFTYFSDADPEDFEEEDEKAEMQRQADFFNARFLWMHDDNYKFDPNLPYNPTHPELGSNESSGDLEIDLEAESEKAILYDNSEGIADKELVTLKRQHCVLRTEGFEFKYKMELE